jgi:hypothetical protein
MKFRVVPSLMCSLMLLASCATPYGEEGYMGGYEANWLSPDVLSVEVSGNAFTTDQRVRDYALLQAAQRAQQAGYKYFTTITNLNQGKVNTVYLPPSATTTTTANVRGSSVYATSNTTMSGGVQQIYKPGRSLMVRMYREVPAGYLPGQYYVVEEVATALGTKYLPKK